ncbi:HAD family hydrolase [Planctomycetes bacterium K23_9]|uniref:Phosphoglycolate phosphatase n=1 Tax=Stieleria marina TaxID=1930275 RepID=A0A517P0G3_9BACT|nr:Phosphoglycolate phosphatase [Planctomycetes bacterium K23_9]
MPEVENLSRAVLDNRHPLLPIATEIEPRLTQLPGVRAVIFDVYGTLVVSGSGDVGSADESEPTDQIGDAMAAIGEPRPSAKAGVLESKLREIIKQTNQSRLNEQCPKPEVDIVAIWRVLLNEIGLTDLANNTKKVVRLAAEFESRANPTWPMPFAIELLEQIGRSDLALGIVSNAQEFTLSLVADLQDATNVEKDLGRIGFDLNLCHFSNRYRQSKPGPRMFDALSDGLKRLSIHPNETIYVGNDMLNDIYAATQAGLRTAWFVGDARSCRPRSDDPRCQDLQADIVTTDLMQLLSCLAIS